jgi:hypothetical protein
VTPARRWWLAPVVLGSWACTFPEVGAGGEGAGNSSPTSSSSDAGVSSSSLSSTSTEATSSSSSSGPGGGTGNAGGGGNASSSNTGGGGSTSDGGGGAGPSTGTLGEGGFGDCPKGCEACNDACPPEATPEDCDADGDRNDEGAVDSDCHDCNALVNHDVELFYQAGYTLPDGSDTSFDYDCQGGEDPEFGENEDGCTAFSPGGCPSYVYVEPVTCGVAAMRQRCEVTGVVVEFCTDVGEPSPHLVSCH